MANNPDIVMWDLAEITDVYPDYVKITFVNDHRCYNRAVMKDDLDSEITKTEFIPGWHDRLKANDKVAFFHEAVGWCKANILNEVTSNAGNIEELFLKIFEVINSSERVPSDDEFTCISKRSPRVQKLEGDNVFF